MENIQLEREAAHYADKQYLSGKERNIAKNAYLAGIKREDLKPTRASFIVPFIIAIMIAIIPVYIVSNIGLSNASDKILFCVFCILFIFFISVTVTSYKTYKRDKMLY